MAGDSDVKGYGHDDDCDDDDDVDDDDDDDDDANDDGNDDDRVLHADNVCFSFLS